ncbi:MAG: hypothetical protein KAX49_16090 [Halanaerobiales bacterium]|nr:hypothetical protein [Halanaerobiales bacterium]
MSKKKKKLSTPRRKSLKRSSRLNAAKKFFENYDGKKILKGYKKHFVVDTICAVKELEMLGVELDSTYIEQVLACEKGRVEAKRHRKEEKEAEQLGRRMFIDYDENFCFIAGFTSGGAPYGLTSEKMGVDPLDFETLDNNNWERVNTGNEEECTKSSFLEDDDDEINYDFDDIDIPF